MVKRRPTQVQDVPNFGEYVVDVYNAPHKLKFGFDEVALVEEEVKEKRAAGDKDAMPDIRRKMLNDEKFHKIIDANIQRSEEIVKEEYVPNITGEIVDAGVDYD